MNSGRILVNGSSFYCGNSTSGLCQLALKSDIPNVTEYIHPTEKQCNYVYTHPSAKQCNYSYAHPTSKQYTWEPDLSSYIQNPAASPPITVTLFNKSWTGSVANPNGNSGYAQLGSSTWNFPSLNSQCISSVKFIISYTVSVRIAWIKLSTTSLSLKLYSSYTSGDPSRGLVDEITLWNGNPSSTAATTYSYNYTDSDYVYNMRTSNNIEQALFNFQNGFVGNDNRSFILQNAWGKNLYPVLRFGIGGTVTSVQLTINATCFNSF